MIFRTASLRSLMLAENDFQLWMMFGMMHQASSL